LVVDSSIYTTDDGSGTLRIGRYSGAIPSAIIEAGDSDRNYQVNLLLRARDSAGISQNVINIDAQNKNITLDGGLHVGNINGTPGDNNLVVDGKAAFGTTIGTSGLALLVTDRDIAKFTSTDATADPAWLTIDRNSASPANNDVLAGLLIQGRNSANETIGYGYNLLKVLNASDASEHGSWEWWNYIAGTDTKVMSIVSGSLLLNAGGLHVGGTSDPGDNNLLVDGKIYLLDAGTIGLSPAYTSTGANIRFDDRSASTDLITLALADVAIDGGTLNVTQNVYAARGLHVGGTSDPGDNNLIVDG
jgi:hypothetical protein